MQRDMKTRFITVSILAGALCLWSCSDMLETEPNGSTITASQKEKTLKNDPSKSSAGVNSLYAQFNEVFGVVSGDRHNDIGFPANIIFMDANGEDLVSAGNGYNWFNSSVDFSSRDYQDEAAILVWSNLYKIIANCNNILAVADRETSNPDALSANGQALALRAFAYWELAQLYAFHIKGHETDACVPLVLESNKDELALMGIERSTVAKVYEQITEDIDEAIVALDKAAAEKVKRGDKRYINNTVAYGLRARINLTLENWSAAASDAAKAIELAEAEGIRPYSIKELADPSSFILMDSSEPSYVWADIIAETDDVVETGICNFSSHMGSMNYGYASYAEGRAISKKLFATIADNDVRKGWWLDESGLSANISAEANAYMADNYSNLARLQVKYGPYKGELGTSTNACDVPLMRVEELYLIKAEALGRDNTSAGVSALNDFVSTYRQPGYSFAASSADAFVDEVFRQRRIELWGEGLNWFDIMRLNKGIDRRGCGFEATAVFNIPAGAQILLWRIPKAEIESNPKISESDNNPSADKPEPVKDI